MHLAVERRANRRSGLHKKIHSQMNRPPFLHQRRFCPEQRRGIEQPCLVVSPNSNRSVRRFHLLEQPARKCMDLPIRRIGAEQRAANAEIENMHRGRSQIRFYNVSSSFSQCSDPLRYFFALRKRRELAGVS